VWGARFVTATVPQVAATVAGRVQLAFATWPIFLKLLNDHFRAIRVKSVEWVRVFEWTPGTDGLGHPHFHLWMFSQFIDHALLRDLWRRALSRVGCDVAAPIVHVEVVTDGERAARELIKYMLRDITVEGGKVPPAVFALVFEALARRRIRHASKGFMGLAKRAKPCCERGAVLPRRVTKKQNAEPAKERNP
jgi:hypothetical protein